MNEFRLYYRKSGAAQFLRFIIDDADGERADSISLVEDGEIAQRRRFLFWKSFQASLLLAPHGRSEMEILFDSQIIEEKALEKKALEKNLYKEYDAFRKCVYATIVDSNPDFSGTKKDLVRLTQRFLGRCIFMLFCEEILPI